MDNKLSFTSADTIPFKLLLNDGVKRLDPIHAQWLPTNRCNLNCSFCSCSERDKSREMEYARAQVVIQDLAELGCKSVTITGGGEPLCYERLPEMIEYFRENGILVGLVTNGTLLERLDQKTLDLITWCRISSSDDRALTSKYRQTLEGAVGRGPNVDWAFSHVVTSAPNHQTIRDVVEFANEHRQFTHVRLVADIPNANHTDLGEVSERLQGIDSLVIYQPRKDPVKSTTCMIGYIKPVISPDFKVYLCCGVQYAPETPSRDLPDSLSIGSAFNLKNIYRNKKVFRVDCARCYYESYNAALRPLLTGMYHEEFV